MHTYRIVQSALPLLLPHVTSQLLQPTVAELLHLVEDRSVSVPEEACTASSKPALTEGEPEVLSIKPNSPVLCSSSTNQVSLQGMLGSLMQVKLISWIATCCTEFVLVYKMRLRLWDDAGEQERLVAEKKKHANRYSLENPRTLERIRTLSQGCCVVMPRYTVFLFGSSSLCSKCQFPLVLVLC